MSHHSVSTSSHSPCSYMVETYPTISPPNIGSALDCDAFIANAQLLLDIFSINVFAESSTLSFEKEVTMNDRKACILRLVSRKPANLWSLQVLKKRNDSPLNNFEVKVLQHYASLSGSTIEVISSGVQNQLEFVHFLSFKEV